MTIHVPDDLERFVRAEVHSGHFASEDPDSRGYGNDAVFLV